MAANGELRQAHRFLRRRLRPRILPSEARKQEDSELSSHIQRLGEIRKTFPPLHGGAYEELLLTNRQYAFLRTAEDGSKLLTAANNDSCQASLTLPCPEANGCVRELLTGKASLYRTDFSPSPFRLTPGTFSA